MKHAASRRQRHALLAGVALIVLATVPAVAAPVLMISVDGLKPEYVLEAEKRGLRIPYLRSLVTEGTYADGVTGVSPTVTYPSHTTLVTGVAPAEHGILANLEFDPERHFKESWFWYADQIRVPTLWQSARAAHLTTASVGWPVTVGAADIDYLIPEYWRSLAPPEEMNASDRYLIAALSRPVDLLASLLPSAGPYMPANDISLRGDETKARFAVEILHRYRPSFMTVHLSSLDEAEHAHGPFSPEANRVLEALDALLRDLAAAARDNEPASVVAIVSDHGFVEVTHRVNLLVPFVRAGFISLATDASAPAPKIASWTAQPWLAGGMAAVMLRDPADHRTEEAVGQLLHTLAADPDNGIAAIETRTGIEARRAFPGATFLIVLKPGYYAGASLTGEVVSPIAGSHGGHGYSPDQPDMRAAFFITGRGIARGRDLGLIDMRQVAPSIARVLGVGLPSAHAQPLALRP